jgi:hypothetical protein
LSEKSHRLVQHGECGACTRIPVDAEALVQPTLAFGGRLSSSSCSNGSASPREDRVVSFAGLIEVCATLSTGRRRFTEDAGARPSTQ